MRVWELEQELEERNDGSIDKLIKGRDNLYEELEALKVRIENIKVEAYEKGFEAGQGLKG